MSELENVEGNVTIDLQENAIAFFEACEAGKGWDGCKAYCTPDASFDAQSGALVEVKTLEAYCDWIVGLMEMIPDKSYELKGFAVDQKRKCALGYAVFRGTHTGTGGPMPPTAKSAQSDYVYHIKFNDAGKVIHMDKIWNDGLAFAQLGWT